MRPPSRLHQNLTAALRGVGSPGEATALLRACAVDLGDAIERHALLVYASLVALCYAVFRAAIGAFTIEPDESWILLSTYRAFGGEVAGAGAVTFPTVTSGGLHFLIHGLLGLATHAIVLHRAISLLFLTGLMLMVYGLMRRRAASPRGAAMAATFVMATPGTVLVSTLAMAEIMATVLLLATAAYWAGRGRNSLAGAALTGLMLGLTCATRANCLVCVPVVCGFACLDAPDWKRGLARAALVLGASLAVYVACLGAYITMFTVGDWSAFRSVLFVATGVGEDKSLGQHLLYLSLAADFFPTLLVAGLLAGLTAGRRSGAELRLPLLLVALALAGALAWVAKAPIPHVRYVWPFAPLLFVAAGLLVQDLGLRERRGPRLAMHLLVIAAVVQQLATALVYVAAGDSLVAVYQANRQAGLNPGIAVHADARDQQAMARAIAALPADAEIATSTPPLGYPLTYLSGRPIRAAREWHPTRPGPLYFLVSPGDHAVFHLNAQTSGWLTRNATPAFRSGGYALYAVTGKEPYR